MKKLNLSSIQNEKLGEAFDSLKLSGSELANLVGGCWCCTHGTLCGANSNKS